jgi:predicted Zn-ribbon and HTH transcriptional regulator
MPGVMSWADEEARLTLPSPRLSLECSSCGYGIVRAKPPERCPMCHAVDTWSDAVWQPLSRERLAD